jgi:Rrf2 family transcriptional regulator, nitric oxide-sensitive transcriptional repressor
VRLTTFTDYSLRVLMYLAVNAHRRATIAEIAAAFDISENHLMKGVYFLGKAGLLVSLRGNGGGLEFAAPADTINLRQVVQLTEGVDRPPRCFEPETNACRITSACLLRHRARQRGTCVLCRARSIHVGRHHAQSASSGFGSSPATPRTLAARHLRRSRQHFGGSR